MIRGPIASLLTVSGRKTPGVERRGSSFVGVANQREARFGGGGRCDFGPEHLARFSPKGIRFAVKLQLQLRGV